MSVQPTLIFRRRYVEQSEMLGQSHAIWLAREGLAGPMLMVFVDTLIETDLSGLPDENAEAVAWVKAVPDPRRFGVAEVNDDGWVTRLIEKPQDVSNNLAVVGFYYFREAGDLLAAIERQMDQDKQLGGEYYLADAINIMLQDGLQDAHPRPSTYGRIAASRARCSTPTCTCLTTGGTTRPRPVPGRTWSSCRRSSSTRPPRSSSP